MGIEEKLPSGILLTSVEKLAGGNETSGRTEDGPTR